MEPLGRVERDAYLKLQPDVPSLCPIDLGTMRTSQQLGRPQEHTRLVYNKAVDLVSRFGIYERARYWFPSMNMSVFLATRLLGLAFLFVNWILTRHAFRTVRLFSFKEILYRFRVVAMWLPFYQPPFLYRTGPLSKWLLDEASASVTGIIRACRSALLITFSLQLCYGYHLLLGH
jgi:hypothetical protein